MIQYDNARILDGLKDALEGKVDVRKDEKIQQTLDGIQEQLVSAAKAKVEQQAKAAKEEGDKYRAEFAKKDGVKALKMAYFTKSLKQVKVMRLKQQIL